MNHKKTERNNNYKIKMKMRKPARGLELRPQHILSVPTPHLAIVPGVESKEKFIIFIRLIRKSRYFQPNIILLD